MYPKGPVRGYLELSGFPRVTIEEFTGWQLDLVARAEVFVIPNLGFLIGYRRYRLVLDPARSSGYDPVSRLDVSLLADHLIAPVLGIEDPRRDGRIDFVGGSRGLEELERRVDSGEMAVGFSLYPTTLGQLMSVADAGKVMPPKSTWFDPKLADGMVSYPLSNSEQE